MPITGEWKRSILYTAAGIRPGSSRSRGSRVTMELPQQVPGHAVVDTWHGMHVDDPALIWAVGDLIEENDGAVTRRRD